ncbi:MAG: hypothetical protein R8N23_07095 [Reichenbachiella sp.]|uniref:hypothetical protein n=1 Tax=Reichenbachiella sp. TaxID=2184521 RepID=UPI0029675B95|nr:hypothetical protein [Reichenbachiella sp.]MDW3209613.1 hypothetical protein [Reichenbachiella sp.]
MKHFLPLAFSVLLFSCSTSVKESTKTELKEPIEQSSIKPSTKEVTKASELSKKREFQKQPLLQLNNTIWVNSPFPNCTDTLSISSNESYYYSCEHELDYDVQFRIESDTLYIDKYGLVSEVSAELGSEVKTKYKFIKSEDLLILVEIAHKYQDRYNPVGEEYLYQEFKQLE